MRFPSALIMIRLRSEGSAVVRNFIWKKHECRKRQPRERYRLANHPGKVDVYFESGRFWIDIRKCPSIVTRRVSLWSMDTRDALHEASCKIMTWKQPNSATLNRSEWRTFDDLVRYIPRPINPFKPSGVNTGRASCDSPNVNEGPKQATTKPESPSAGLWPAWLYGSSWQGIEMAVLNAMAENRMQRKRGTPPTNDPNTQTMCATCHGAWTMPAGSPTGRTSCNVPNESNVCKSHPPSAPAPAPAPLWNPDEPTTETPPHHDNPYSDLPPAKAV